MSDKGTTLVSRLLVDLETVFDEVSSTLGEKDDVATVPSDVTSVVSIVKEIYNEVTTIAQGTSLFAKSAPDTMEIDDSGTYSLELYDIGDAIPVSAEITAGNYQIDRVRNGALTNIVTSTGASKGDGRIYASEDFTAVAGWAVGDIVLVTFSGGSILTGGVTTTLPNAYFYTRITRGESIETKIDIIDTNIDEILDLTRTGADISVGAAETNLFIDDAPSKIINGLSIKIDTTDMQSGDTYEFKEYYRIESLGSYIEVANTITLTDAQSEPLYVIHLEPYRYGCKITAKKTVGTDRAFPIEAIREE